MRDRRIGSAFPGLAFPKGQTTRGQDKTAGKREAEAHRQQIRRRVWSRSQGRCETCGDTEAQTRAAGGQTPHHLHEKIFRSQTRNQAPEVRFSMENCERRCCFCHNAAHGVGAARLGSEVET